MVCNKCGTEVNFEGAQYCNECGTRLDGRVQCAHCGEFNAPEWKYCVHCGTRMDGKTVCACGMAYEGNFCPMCGKAAHAKNKAQRTPAPSKAKKKVLDIIRDSFLMFGVLAALVFTFFIGMSVKVIGTAPGGIDIAANGPVKMNLFYYFGEAYKEIREIKAAVNGSTLPYVDKLLSMCTIESVLGTVVSALTILGVITFAVFAILHTVQYHLGKRETSGVKWAVYSILTYLGCAVCIYLLNAAKIVIVNGYDEAQQYVVKTKYNGGTIVGIIFALTAIAGHAVTTLIQRGKAWKDGKFIVGAVCTTVGVILTLVLCAIAKNSYTGVSYENGGIMISTKGAASVTLSMLIDMMQVSSGIALNAQEYMEYFFAFQLVETLAIFSIAVCAVLSIAHRIKHLHETNKNGFFWTAAIMALSVVSLVFGILVQSQAKLIFEGFEQFFTVDGIGIGAPIVCVVFATLGLATSIVQMLCMRPRIPAEEPLPETEEFTAV